MNQQSFDLGITDSQKLNTNKVDPFKTQLLKWIGNKQRFAHEIISFFPPKFHTYHEPFLGSGGVLGALAPSRAIASDTYKPLIEIFVAVRDRPADVKKWYKDRWILFNEGDRVEVYESIKKNFNENFGPEDFLFLTRSAYGGVVRFRKSDGYMSTPCGPHDPIHFSSFGRRVDAWSERIKSTQFLCRDFEETFDAASKGDVVYCDPPYSHSQAILYGAQSFSFERLISAISRAKERGVFTALSLDGSKKSGLTNCDYEIPSGLFELKVPVNCGRSMLRRFQMKGETLESEVVTDALYLTEDIRIR